MDPRLRPVALDHIVLRCHDVERTLSWYVEKLGLEPLRVHEWRAGEAPFPSLRINETTIIDLLATAEVRGDGRLDHFCIVIEAVDLDALAESGRFDVVDGPGTRFGARGHGRSLYVLDPDGCVVELRHY